MNKDRRIEIRGYVADLDAVNRNIKANIIDADTPTEEHIKEIDEKIDEVGYNLNILATQIYGSLMNMFTGAKYYDKVEDEYGVIQDTAIDLLDIYHGKLPWTKERGEAVSKQLDSLSDDLMDIIE